MTELVLRFEHLVGRAALRLWSDLPRDLQERLFEDAVGGDETPRHHLAVYLHEAWWSDEGRHQRIALH